MIHVLVVVYNKNAESSEACKSLLRQTSASFRVYLWDNSDTNFGLESYCRKHEWTYLGGKGNIGLSKAYNEALKEIEANGDCRDWFCPLDDDTELPDDYFSQVEHYLSRFPTQISVPIVFSGSGIVSPWRDSTIWLNRFFKNIDECISADTIQLLAFNTGMLIPLSVFITMKYDEKLFTDWIDISFLHSARENSIDVKVIPVEIRSCFSGKEKPELDKALKRFELYVRDTEAMYRKKKLKGKTIALKRAFHLAMQYCSFEFIKLTK